MGLDAVSKNTKEAECQPGEANLMSIKEQDTWIKDTVNFNFGTERKAESLSCFHVL